MAYAPTPRVNGEPVETGCKIEGHVGQFGAKAICEIADALTGSTLTDDWPTHPEDGSEIGTSGEVGSPFAPLMGDDKATEVIERMDKAESALNEATEGGHWIWEDGELFLRADHSLFFCNEVCEESWQADSEAGLVVGDYSEPDFNHGLCSYDAHALPLRTEQYESASYPWYSAYAIMQGGLAVKVAYSSKDLADSELEEILKQVQEEREAQ